MQKSVALIFFFFIYKVKADLLLQVDHHYEALNFDTSNLIKLKLHREKRSIKLDDKLFEKEIKDKLHSEIDKNHFLEEYDRELAKNRLNHFYSKPTFENHFDDDQFNKKNFLNLHKNEAINEKLKDKNFEINFFAHNRNFKILIKGNHNNDVFAPNAEFESTNRGKFNYDKHNIFHGSLEDDNGSHVEGVITHDGLIDGFIKTKDEEFFIEPARNYAKNKTDLHNKIHNNLTFHSIIYKLSDLTFPNFTCKNHFHDYENFQKNNHFLNKRHALKDSFESNVTLDSKLMKESQINSSPYTNSSSKLSEADILNNKYLQIARKNKVARNNSYTKKKYPKKNEKVVPLNNRKYYWKEMDALHYNSEAYGVRAIQKTHWTSDVEQSHLVVDSRKSTCMLYLQADHLFYSKMGSEEACIETMIRHVQKVNSIYRVTDFDQDGRSDNISFLIKRIKVHTTDAVNDSEYRFPLNYGVERFLELFSEEDYDAFCLAYMFTYRDFEGGTLGLAWTGDLKNAGGVCEKNGHYRGSLKSLNTGIVTLLNYGKHVPPIVSHVTLAHEIGHNFGSPHDPEVDEHCTPGGENGNYIMFARATSGDKKNNNKFSPCSLKSVNAVLNTKARSLKGCFQEPQEAICGNEVVEPGEECDCGWVDGCTEPCCYPMRSNPPANETPCKLKPGFVCSPSQGPCCTHECKLRVGNKCRDDNGCRTASYCNGQGPKCPLSTNKPNKTICNEESVCFMGECTGSICIAYGLESCQCKKKEKDQSKRGDQLCELCCRMPGDDSTCKTSFEWNTVPYDVPDLFAKPGTPCDNYNGYCDVNQVCRILNPSGALEALATLRRFLLSDQSVAFLRNWVQHQWMCAGVLCCIAFVLCGLLLRALRKANAFQQVQYKNSSSLINPNVLCNNPISNGFLFSTPNNYNQNNNSTNIATTLPNSNFENSINNTYSLTSNTNYSNAYSFNSVANDNSSVIKNTFTDYGINNSSSINKSTDLNKTLFNDLKNKHAASFLTNSINKDFPNSIESEIQNLQIKNLNSTTLNQSSKINSLSQNQQTVKQNSTTYNTNDFNEFQSNFSSYDSNINLVKRQNRLINESLMKNIPSINNLVSSSTSSVNNFNKNNNSALNNNYIQSSKTSTNKFSNSALSYQHQLNNLNQQNSMTPNYQPFQTQYFQQAPQSVNKNNSTATKATEYGHTPLSLNNEWV